MYFFLFFIDFFFFRSIICTLFKIEGAEFDQWPRRELWLKGFLFLLCFLMRILFRSFFSFYCAIIIIIISIIILILIILIIIIL